MTSNSANGIPTRPLGKTPTGTGMPDLTIDVHDDNPGLDCYYQRHHAA